MKRIPHKIAAFGVAGAVMAGLMSAAVAQEFPDPSGGVKMTPEQCSLAQNSMWIDVDGQADCIRYYASGLKDKNAKAIFYTHGDVMWGKQQSVVPAYKTATAGKRQELVDKAAADAGMPVVMIARPGLYGSSGEHGKRRQMRELKLVEAALREIRTRHSIAEFAITGQSGGGSVAAYLAAQMPEAKCVVFTSSALSLTGLKNAGQTDGYVYNNEAIYDPSLHIDAMGKSEGRRIFIIGDPQDEYALIGNQIDYFEKAKAKGLNVLRIEAEGDGHHSLDRTGWNVAGWCMGGASDDDIVKKIKAGAVRY